MDGNKRCLGLVLHGERAFALALREAVARLREAGHAVMPRVTWESGDGTRYARELCERGADTVIAGGGDGTVNEVLNGISGETALGILPLGTANDFARQAGIPGDVEQAFGVILDLPARRVDTAELNGRRFLNASTGGIGAEIVADTSVEAKRAFGSIAYVITALGKLVGFTPHRVRFAGPDWSFAGEVFLFAVGNAQATGGGRRVTPAASVRDGLLDLCVVEAMPTMDFARVALRLQSGEHVTAEGVHYVQLPWVRVEAEAPLAVNLDGEPQSLTVMEYRARARDLRIHLPHLPEAGAAAP